MTGGKGFGRAIGVGRLCLVRETFARPGVFRENISEATTCCIMRGSSSNGVPSGIP